MDIEPGLELPIFERVAGFAAWNRYAAVNDEFVPIHSDDEAGRNAGFPGAIGMGNLSISYFHALVRQWIGDDGRIVSMTCQFRAPSLRGHRTIVRGRVVGVEIIDHETIVDLELVAETEEGVVMTPGTARVALKQPPTSHQRAGRHPVSACFNGSARDASSKTNSRATSLRRSDTLHRE